MGKKLLIGLTGRSGSGKTTASAYFAKKGIPVINSDIVVREVEEAGKPCLKELVKTFGDSILDQKGELNRRELASLCFGNPENLANLNSIVHPFVLERISELAEGYYIAGNSVCIVEAPQLVESHLIDRVDKVILVTAPDTIDRLVLRDGLDRDTAQRRLSSQIPEEILRTYADLVVENNSTIADFQNRLEEAYQIINSWKQEN